MGKDGNAAGSVLCARLPVGFSLRSCNRYRCSVSLGCETRTRLLSEGYKRVLASPEWVMRVIRQLGRAAVVMAAAVAAAAALSWSTHSVHSECFT